MRRFPSFVLLAVLAAIAGGGCSGPPDQRPNILVIVSDDQSWLHTSEAGDPVVETPGFDTIARHGALFTHGFAPAPSCSPSRAALLTGRPIWQLGPAASLDGPLLPSYAVYPDLLEQAGYTVGFTGKGWGPGSIEECGRPRNPAGREFTGGDYVENFRSFLATVPKGAPFCFWFGSFDPHVPYDAPPTYRGRQADVVLPPQVPDSPAIRERMLDYYAEVKRFDDHVAAMLTLLARKKQLANTLVIITSDNGVDLPRAKTTLYDFGTHVPLAIAWPRGFTGGATLNELVNLTDVAPTILDAAGVPVPSAMEGRSLLPLLRDGPEHALDSTYDHVVVARERHTPYREGMRSYPSRAIRTRNFLYIRNFAPDRWPAGDPPYYADSGAPELFNELLNAMADSVRTRYEGLWYAKRPAEELYDLRSDPYELTNVAGRPEYAAIQVELRAELESYLAATGDPRVRGEDGGWDSMGWSGELRFPVREIGQAEE